MISPSKGPFRKIHFNFIARFLLLIGKGNKVALTLSAILKSEWTPQFWRAFELIFNQTGMQAVVC